MNNHNEVCPICKSSNVIADLESAEIVCSNCGMVISDKIHARTRLARHDTSLSTVIGNTDSGRNQNESSMLPILSRLRSWDFRTWLKNSSDCNLKVAYNIHYV